MLLANIFSHSVVGCFLLCGQCLLVHSFKKYVFIKSSLPLWLPVPLIYPRRYCQTQCQNAFAPCFKSCIVLDLTIQLWVHVITCVCWGALRIEARAPRMQGKPHHQPDPRLPASLLPSSLPFFLFLFWDRISLSCPGWPSIFDFPAPASWVAELWAYTTPGPWIYLEFTFCIGVSKVLTSSFCLWTTSLLSTICGKDCLFPMVLAHLPQASDQAFKGLFVASIQFHWSTCPSWWLHHNSDYCDSVFRFEIRKSDPPALFRIILAIWGPLRFYIHLKWSISVKIKKKHCCDFGRDYIYCFYLFIYFVRQNLAM